MSNEKQEYLLLFRGSDNWHMELSLEELQQVMGKIKAWFDGLAEKGIVKGGQPLEAEGRTVSGKGGRTVSDGPFAESKETIGGYALILAESMDEAVKIAQGCPPLEYGDSIEVRPVAEECPKMAHARDLFREKQLAGVSV
jgi:hypothetical protein